MVGSAWSGGPFPTVCTSATRPSAPFQGMEIFETDTTRFLAWSGTKWARISHVTSAGRTGCVLRRVTAGMSIATGVESSISYDTETFDSDGFFPGPVNTTVTVPAGLGGLYVVVGFLATAVAMSGRTFVNLLQNSAPMTRFNMPVTEGAVGGSTVFDLAVGDTVRMTLYHSNAAAVAINEARLELRYLHP